MSEASLKFDGRLIEELSQKIPSSLFALNELIKNAYDAFSPDITIKVEPSRQVVTVSDNGNGMEASEIEGLFHIAKSSKKYGHVIEQGNLSRLTQGSKGLGFLAAFKFGEKVTWITRKNGTQSTFTLNKSDLIAKEDLTGTKIPIITEAHDGKGTEIVIHSNTNSIDELIIDLADERVSEKLAAAIIDEQFDIKIDIENQPAGLSTKKLKDFKLESESDQLFYVSFNSTDNNIEFYHQGELLQSISGLPDSMRRSDYTIGLELMLFYFGRGKNSKSISALNRRVHDDALYPLIYFNKNLFNNTVLFDPEVLRKSSSSATLPQMIGRVSLRSQSHEIEFNSDRTNFVESPLTKSLAKDLKYLNELIQTKGSEIKKELQDNNSTKKVPTGKAAPISKPSGQKKKAAQIQIDRKIPVEFFIPSDQIELTEYLFQVKNSLTEDVSLSEVKISVDDQPLEDGILPSTTEPCEKVVRFHYNDPHTGLACAEISLQFSKKVSNVTGGPEVNSLFKIESHSGYKLTQGIISNLIFAIDKAYQSKNRDHFLPLIASSMRCIFEASWVKIHRIRKNWFSRINKTALSPVLKRELKGELIFGVMHVLILLKKNPLLLTEVSQASGISFNTLSNLLDLPAFGSAVKLSNVGAHSSSGYLSKPKIEECAATCGLFSVICDILINMDTSAANDLNINKLDESDFESEFSI